MCQVCSPSHSFCAPWERALRAQVWEFRDREAVMWANTLQRGMAIETSLYPLATCAFLGVSPSSCKAEEGPLHCTWWMCSGRSQWEQLHVTTTWRWRWMSLTEPGSSLTQLTNPGEETSKAVSPARKMDGHLSLIPTKGKAQYLCS